MLTELQPFLLPWNTARREAAACPLLTVVTGGVWFKPGVTVWGSRGRGWALVGIGVKSCVSLEEGDSL